MMIVIIIRENNMTITYKESKDVLVNEYYYYKDFPLKIIDTIKKRCYITLYLENGKSVRHNEYFKLKIGV